MCTSPNYIVYNGLKHDGKEKFSFLGHLQYNRIKNELNLPFVSVPCGKCLECRIQYSRAWADRCVLEARNSPHNYFVTLTYDDYYIGDNKLNVRDIQLFMKRLRKRFKGIKIKYFACGEYGNEKLRKHYHLILFNCPLNDLDYTFKHLNPLTKHEEKHYVHGHQNYFFSQTIFEAWQKVGNVVVAPFCYQTAAYVSQYVIKKVDGTLKDKYEKVGKTPEFITMSNGLARDQYNDDIVFGDFMSVERSGSCVHSHCPRYFDKIFKKKYGDEVFYRTVGKNRARLRFLKRSQPDDDKKDNINEFREHRNKTHIKFQRSL